MADKKPVSLGRLILIMIPAILIALAVLVYFTWYQHVENGDSPYDEIFIEINGLMPAPARDWACGRIAERFPGTLPPHSCTADAGQ